MPVHVQTLTVDDGSGQDGSHGGLLRQELDAVQQPGWVHALTQRHVVHRLQTGVKVHRKRHQLLALHHVLGGSAPQLATWTKQEIEETFKRLLRGRRERRFVRARLILVLNVRALRRRRNGNCLRTSQTLEWVLRNCGA